MLFSPYLVVYNVFRDEDRWPDVDLTTVPVLLYAAVTRQFIARSTVTRQTIPPATHHELPRRWINATPDSRRVTAWRGTPLEIEFATIGEGGKLVERDVTAPFGQQDKILMPSIPFGDDATIGGPEPAGIHTS